MLRTIAERLSRGVVFTRRLPQRFGGCALRIAPEAGGLKYWKPLGERTDPELFGFAERYVSQATNIWDVGANLGLFSFLALGLNSRARVLAIEPDLWLANLMTQSRSLNPDGLDFTVLPIAVADRVQTGRLAVSSRARAASHLATVSGSTQTGGDRYIQPTLVLTLDFLAEQFGAPDLVKIDVETAEVLVLRGAEKVLEESHPTVYCEVGKETAREVHAIFSRYGYQVLEPTRRSVVSKEQLASGNVPPNFLAIHPSRAR